MLCLTLEIGGTERQLVLLANGLAARGHDVLVLAVRGGGPLQQHLSAAVQVQTLDYRGVRDWPRTLMRFVRAVRSFRSDVVYAFLTVSNLMLALCRPWIDGRCVWSIRASTTRDKPYGRRHRWCAWLEDRLSRLADLTIANSESGATEARRHGWAGRIEVVPNGVDQDRFRPSPTPPHHETLRIGFVGRDDPMKGLRHFLDALHRFREADYSMLSPGRTCTVVRHTLRHRSWGPLPQQLHQPEEFYRHLDVLTVPSLYGEGCANVILEGMSSGAAIVATDVGDARQMLGETGLIVPPNDIDAILRAWRLLADNRTLRRSLGRAARKRACACYGASRLLDRTEDLLHGLCP